MNKGTQKINNRTNPVISATDHGIPAPELIWFKDK